MNQESIIVNRSRRSNARSGAADNAKFCRLVNLLVPVPVSRGRTSRITGKERDAESGLDDFSARSYSSPVGRFVEADPVGGHTEDPQSLNRYTYVRNLPLTLTDPTGLDFYLSCGKGSTTCQDVAVGVDKNGNGIFAKVEVAKDANGDLKPIEVGNKSDGSGGLTDNKAGTGAYSGSFDGKTVTLADSAGRQSSGIWIPGSNETKGISGGGELGSRFSFTFMNHGLTQTLNATWKFAGTRTEAEAILEKAGYKYFGWLGKNVGYDEFRLPATGSGSTHFNVAQTPEVSVPAQTTGNMHAGEHFPGSVTGIIEHWSEDK